MLGLNRIIAKTLKIVRVGGRPWSQTGVTHYHTQIRLPDKDSKIKGLVVCNIVRPGSMI